MARVGIRHEDKSEWEARVALVPQDLAELHRTHGIEFHVQGSPRRAFADAEYLAAGATVAEDLTDCPVVLGVKEIPPEAIEAGRTYVFFSHTIKGQTVNMPLLRRVMAQGAQLIDYEKVVDEDGRRLVFFGRFAGLAGMVDSLWALGQRLKHEGFETPFERLQPAHHYPDLERIRTAVKELGAAIQRDGLPDSLAPLVIGVAGYGQVSQGAQEILALLPLREVDPDGLSGLTPDRNVVFKTVFKEQHMARPRDPAAQFELQDYYANPERYEAAFAPYIPYLSLLMNCIYWDPRYPKLITREQFRTLYEGESPRLRVVGDISCDIDGSVECTTHATTPGNPVYVYDASTGTTREGVEGNGPVVLAVDFLPCEIPVDASVAFSAALRDHVPNLAAADFTRPLAESGLSPVWQRATIVYQGELTEGYRYLREFVE